MTSRRVSTLSVEAGPPAMQALTSREQRMWLLEQLQPGTPLHAIPLLVTLRGRLDRHALEEALTALVERHPSLRRTIFSTENGPVASICSPLESQIAIADLAAGEDVGRTLEQEARRPIDPSAAPLVRAVLASVAPDVHVLLIAFHELGCDRESAPSLVAELAMLYGTTTDGADVGPPGDNVEEATSCTSSEDDLAYWRSHLDGSATLLELPTDRPRPPVQSLRGARWTARLDAGAAEALSSLVRGYAVEEPAVILAALTALLQRYAGRDDIVVGTRARVVDALAGGMNTLVGRLSLEDDPSLDELARRAQQELTTASAHAALPFERLVEELDPERDLSRSPLFQVAFAYHEALAPIDANGVEFSVARLFQGATPYDVALDVERGPDGISATVDVSLDIFEPDTAERMLGHLETFLVSAAAAPDASVSSHEILTSPERDELIVHWNDTHRSYPNRCLHELVADQASRTPGAIAVRGNGEELTYAALDESANRLARHLQARGAGLGDRVALLIDRRPALVVSMLAVLKTGAAYVPLDPSYPRERLAFMLDDADVRLTVTERALADALPEATPGIVLIDAEAGAISKSDPSALETQSLADQLAYVIYTSGSTGRPKGVEIRHRSVVNLLWHMRDEPGIGPGDVLVNLTTPAFDLSVPDWYLPLVSGATLVILARDTTLDAAMLAEELRAAGATFVQATPTTWSMLVESGWDGLAGLKIVAGGEALPRSLADTLLERGASLWHMYGPTETTVWSAILKLARQPGPPPIGGPIANTTFSVLDEHGRLVPTGVPGQLHIGGDGVARGYRNRADLTEQKFIEDPFRKGERLYATGDLVRRRPAGTLEFLGRMDHQVKLRGFRIELGEVEAIIDRQPEIAASVAVVREDVPGKRQLVAYVVPEPGATLDGDSLRAALARELPPYMIPSTIAQIDALPTTANLKVDRTALPPIDDSQRARRTYQPPRTPVEEIVAVVWQEVLAVDRVGLDDDFFDLGGNSLLATLAVARLRGQLGIPISLRTVFELSTTRLFAADLVRSLAEEAALEEDLTPFLAESPEEAVR
jgi:amino acid adenylation domain-containing protein